MTDRPSVASLVWSTNNRFTRYNSMSRVQHPRTEIIVRCSSDDNMCISLMLDVQADMRTMVEVISAGQIAYAKPLTPCSFFRTPSPTSECAPTLLRTG
jgi:hypothetical protein